MSDKYNFPAQAKETGCEIPLPIRYRHDFTRQIPLPVGVYYRNQDAEIQEVFDDGKGFSGVGTRFFPCRAR
jgi:hypothetical protein